MLADPIEQGAFETDVVAEPLGLDPLVLQDLLPLGEKFLVEVRLFDELLAAFGLAGDRCGHGDAGTQ